MPKPFFKVSTTMMKGEAAKGAKGKHVAKQKAKNKKKSTAKPPVAKKSTTGSSSAAKPCTSRLSVEPNTSEPASFEASPNTSSTSIETLSSAASQELNAKKIDANLVEISKSELIEKSNPEKDGSSSEISEAVTETASEESQADTNAAKPLSRKTIPQSPQPLSILENKWTLWFYTPKKGIPWEECQERVYSFNTVEHFWSMFDHLKKPSELPAVADLALFKKDYRPMWEDAINKNGGRWLITLTRHRQKDVENVWREASMFVIGEYYKYSDSVCGIVLSHRMYCDKIAIWTKNKLEHEVMSIGQHAKRNMLLDFSPQMAFESHAETQFNASTFGKASSKTLYTI